MLSRSCVNMKWKILNGKDFLQLVDVSKVGFATVSKTELEARRAQIMSKGLPRVKPIPGVKDIILVSSGKGGVGKTTTSVNLAVGMKIAYPEKSIGLLDADVFGPSVPLMMNLNETPLLSKDNLMIPLMNYGVKCMSMGFLIAEGSPVIWRGLMVMQALERLMRQVDWSDTDCLIIDTPPGTGDTHLSLVQNLPITGAVLVTTPQAAAVQVTKRGAEMFKKLNVPIVGIVENMSTVKCPSCSKEVKLFGDGVKSLAETLNIDIIARVPLEQEISERGDAGTPIVFSKSNSLERKVYLSLAKNVSQFLSKKVEV